VPRDESEVEEDLDPVEVVDGGRLDAGAMKQVAEALEELA
jgi:hypothetical protein